MDRLGSCGQCLVISDQCLITYVGFLKRFCVINVQ